MNTRTQIRIDKYIARPAAMLMNYAVRLAGKLLRPDHNLQQEFKTIVVCKFKGMGSILQATPLLKALRERFPQAEIVFVSTAGNLSLLEQIPTINSVLTINDQGFFSLLSSCAKTLFKLIKKRPGVYIDLEIYSDFSSLFAALTLSRNRFGFYLRSSSFRMGIYTHMMYFNTRLPVSKVYLQFASAFGPVSDHYTLASFDQIANAPALSNKPYIVINPNASDLRLERRWPAPYFINLIQVLATQYPEYNFLFIGSAAEKEYTTKIVNSCPADRTINTAGNLSISALVDVIRGAKLMITNDTGPMHIAFCVQTPVVCLFGPCSPDQYIFPENAYPIYKSVYCSPCVHDFEIAPCLGNHICMQWIQVEEVLQTVTLALQKQPKPLPATNTFWQTTQGEAIGWVHRQAHKS